MHLRRETVGTLSANPHPVRRQWMPPYAITIEVITTALLIIRLCSRWNKLGGRAGIDDVFVTTGWFLGLVATAGICYSTIKLGFDRHIADVEVAIWEDGALSTWILEFFVIYSTHFTKLSVLLFYRRLVAGTVSKKFKLAIYLAIFFVVASLIIFTVLLFVTCKPFTYEWTQYSTVVHQGTCVDSNTTVVGAVIQGSFSVISDLYSVLLPAALLLQIRISRRQRWGLMFIFGLGFMVVVAGCVRTFYLSKAEGTADKSWYVFDAYVASIAEMNIAIICACAPSLKSVTGQFFRDISSKSNSKESSRNDEKNETTFSSEKSNKLSTQDSTAPIINKRNSIAKSTGSLIRKFSTTKYQRPKNNPLKDLTSFAEAHEHGMDVYSSVVEGYDDKPITYLAPPSSTHLPEGRSSPIPAAIAVPLGPHTVPQSFSGSQPIPSAVITIRPPSAVESAQNITALPRGLTRAPGQTLQAAGTHDLQSVSPVSSNTPSIIFINNENDTESVVRVKYRSFAESTNSEENLALSFPAMNPVHTRSQSLRDANELAAKAALRLQAQSSTSVDGRPFTSPAESAIPQLKEAPKPANATRTTMASSPAASTERGWVRNALNSNRVRSSLSRSRNNATPTSLSRYRHSQSHIESPSESETSSTHTVSSDDGPILPLFHPDASDDDDDAPASPERVATTAIFARPSMPQSNNPYASAMTGSNSTPVLATQHALSTPLYSVFPAPQHSASRPGSRAGSRTGSRADSRAGSRPGTAPGESPGGNNNNNNNNHTSGSMVRTYTTITQHSESASNTPARWRGASLVSSAVGPASVERSASAMGSYAQGSSAARGRADDDAGVPGIGRPAVRRVLSRERSRWYP